MSAERPDDPSIGDEEWLWRRVMPTPILVVMGADGQPRPTSAAFLDNYTGELSVHRAVLTTTEHIVSRYPDLALAAIQANLPRSLGHRIISDPILASESGPGDPSHALVCGPAGQSNKRRKSDARRMAESSVWVVPPSAVASD